jgi:carotenoid cleavage dioxygenase
VARDEASNSAAEISAHTKVDDHTGELLFFNYRTEHPYLHYGVVDARERLVHYVPIDLPGPRLPHDMAYTEHYAILNDLPLFWEPVPSSARSTTASAGGRIGIITPPLTNRAGSCSTGWSSTTP